MPELAASAYPAHKTALRLLVDCVKAKFGFHMRVVRPDAASPAAAAFDAALLSAAGGVLGWSAEELEAARGQLVRRPVDGGLALGPERERLPFAYLGSWLDAGFGHQASADTAVGRLLREVFEACRQRNADHLPPSLEAFLAEAEESEVESKYQRADGSPRWQALLSRGREAAAAKRWREGLSGPERNRLDARSLHQGL